MTSTAFLVREHVTNCHKGWKHPECTACYPNGLPVASPPMPVIEPEPEPRQPTIYGEGIARMQSGYRAVLERQRRRPNGDEDVPEFPRDPNVADDGGPICEVCHSFRFVRQRLPVDHPDFGRAVKCSAPECFAWTQQRSVERLWGRLPSRLRGWTLDTFPQSASKHRALLKEARLWLDDPDEPWLVLIGDVGTMKTGLAVGLLHDLTLRGKNGTFKVVPDLLAQIRSTYGTKENAALSETTLLDSLATMDVLVLDEFGKQGDTDWAAEMLFRIINSRHNDKRRTIITANLSMDALMLRLKGVGDPTISRIEESAGRGKWVISTFGWPDMRKADA